MTTRSMPMTTIGVTRGQRHARKVDAASQGYRSSPGTTSSQGLLRAEPLREGTRELAGSFETRTAKGRGLPRVSFYASQREFDSLTLFAGSTAPLPHDMLGW